MSAALVRWLGRAGLVGGIALVFVGCPEDPSEITEFASGTVWNFPIAASYIEPEGSASLESFILAAIDTTVTDAFDRAGSFNTEAPDYISFVTGCPAANSRCPGREWPIRNGTVDTRLPALQDPDAAALFGIVADSVFGAPLWLISTAGLEPATQYTMTLERLAITPAGGLDATNTLLDNPELGGLALSPDGADQLALLGGTPGTTIGSNPYSFATFTTDAGGGGFFNNFMGGSDSNFETNAAESFALPNYNYVVVYQGDAATGTPVLRAQIGTDLTPSGGFANNGLAPFPTAALSPSDVLAAPGGAGRPDALEITFNNLEALTGGAVYQAWLVNPSTSEMVPAVGTYNRIKILLEIDPVTGQVVAERDSIVETVTETSSFVGGNTEDGFRHQLIVSDATMPGGAQDTVGFYEDVVLTIAGSGPASSIPDARPFWWPYTDQNGTPENLFDDSFEPDDNDTNFGNYNVTNASLSRIFAPSGQGTGGFREDQLVVQLSRLSRPPVGYQFVGWLTLADGSMVMMPELTTPPPDQLSLVNADVERIGDVVTNTGILSADIRTVESELGIMWGATRSFLLTLEPKAGAAGVGPIPVQTGAVPENIQEQQTGGS